MTCLLKPISLIFILTLIVQSNNLLAINVDSIEQKLNNKYLSNSEKIRLYNELSRELASTDLRKATHYASQGIRIAENGKDLLMAGFLYRNAGVAYYMFSVFDSSKICLDKANGYGERLNNPELKLSALSALANLYNAKGSFPEAINFYMRAISIAERVKNKQRLNILYANLSGVYTRLKNWTLAEKYLIKTIDLSKQLSDFVSLGQAYNNLSDIYLARNDFAKAIECEKQAILKFQKCGNTEFESISTQGLAMIYYKMPNPDYSKAEIWAKRALELSKLSGLPRDISGALCMLSNVYLKWGKYNLAELYALKSYKSDSTDSNLNSNIMANLAWANIHKGNAELAIEYMNRYRGIIDERATQLYQQAVSETEIKYETEKKEAHIESLLKEKHLYGAITLTTGVCLCLLLLILALLYKNMRQKKAIAEQRVAQLEKEKQLVATQAVLEGETAERSRLARDLHDGLGGLLSAVKLNLFDIKKGVVIDSEDIFRFDKVIDMLDQSMHELRRVAHNMMPESLSRYGLRVSLNAFCSSFPIVKFHFFGHDCRFNQEVETTIYRATLELVNNAVKHSHATTINVQLVQDPDRISLLVEDNGQGFNPEEIQQGSGFRNIKNRIHSIGGSLNLLSSSGKGSEITIEINLIKLSNE